MLLKYTQAQKRIKAAGKPQRTTGGMVKLSSGLVTVVPKIHRRVIKVASKRPAPLHRTPVALKRERISLEACDNSNDSGLGFDHHLDYHASLASHSALRFSDKEAPWHTEESPEEKRRRLEIKLESDDANDNFTFPESVRQPQRAVCMPIRGRVVVPQAALTLSSQLSSVSRNGLVQLAIACQPEQQHRARYQTEGSRGAVKDRTGNGFPVVKLLGYDRPVTLQVFIGTDQGRVTPHMFYQACRVSGKNSTPCVEKKVDGTIVIEVDVEPAKDMVVTCDCVGILKERNVDVEHRFPEEGSGRSKKKSTRCRMVFRTTITNPDGSQETLQVTSQPIVCTQPPGVPEICKKSLSSCCVQGGQELFILGKNFLKDTRVVFQEGDSWSQSVQPDKEFLQQSHLVCVVPPYKTLDISEPVTVRLLVESSGKASEPHAFVYLPAVLATDGPHTTSSVIAQGGSTALFPAHLPGPPPLLLPSEATAPFVSAQTSPRNEDKVQPVMMWEKPVDMIMPPPSSLIPLPPRRSSVQMIVPDQLDPEDLKREVPDTVMDTSTNQQGMINGSDLSSTRSPSIDTIRRFVSNNSLPTINVSSYLSNIEGNIVYADKTVPSHSLKDMPQIMIPSVNNSTFSGDSSNLLTTVNQSAPMPFDTRSMTANSVASQSAQENLSVIVNSSMIQKKVADNVLITDSQQHKPMANQQQNVGLDILVSNLIKKEAEMTERLDAFVNSAAERHISRNAAPVSITSGAADRPVIHSVSEMAVNQDQTVPSIQATMGQFNNTNQTDMNSLMRSPPQVLQVSTNQSEVFSDLKASLEEQLSNQSVASSSPSQMGCRDLNIMQTPQDSSSHAQQLANLQATLNHQLSPRTVVVSANHSDLSNLVQTSQAANLHILSIEPKLSPRNLSSTQIDHSNFNNMMSATPQGTTSNVSTYSNLQTSMEQHLSSQGVNSTQISHSECVQSNSPSLNDVNSVMHTSPQASASEAHALSNLQASLEHQLSSQIMRPVQQSHDSLASRNLVLNSSLPTSPEVQVVVSQDQALSNLQASLEHPLPSQIMRPVQQSHDSLASTNLVLNSSLPTSPEVQVVVSQAQALSNLQASLEHHLSSQVMEPPRTILEPIIQVSHSQNSLNPTLDVSQNSVNQAQTLNNLHLSLEHLTSQALTPPLQINSQTMTVASDSSSISCTGILSSPPTHPSAASILTSPGMSLRRSPSIDVSPSGLTLHNPQPMEITSSNIVMNSSTVLSSPELTLRDSAAHRLQQSEFQMQCSQNTRFQQNGASQFEQASPNIAPSLPIQVATMAQYDQCREMQCNEIKQERKEQSPFVAPPRVTPAPAQTVKKAEEGNLALPQELTQMSEHDLISYINPSCFDTV